MQGVTGSTTKRATVCASMVGQYLLCFKKSKNERGNTGVKKMDYERLIQEARKHVEGMDDAESDSGFATPIECPLPIALDSVKAALECSIKLQDWETAAEAIVMLEQMIEKAREFEITSVEALTGEMVQ